MSYPRKRVRLSEAEHHRVRLREAANNRVRLRG